MSSTSRVLRPKHPPDELRGGGTEVTSLRCELGEGLPRVPFVVFGVIERGFCGREGHGSMSQQNERTH